MRGSEAGSDAPFSREKLNWRARHCIGREEKRSFEYFMILRYYIGHLNQGVYIGISVNRPLITLILRNDAESIQFFHLSGPAYMESVMFEILTCLSNA